ncbi:MAG: VanW family protein [Candidatus Gracilibacteria bacterium]
MTLSTIPSTLPPLLVSSMKMFESPLARKLSNRSKLAYTTAIQFYRAKRHWTNLLSQHAHQKSNEYLPSVVARHQSLLMKKLGENNEHLQRQKITNLRVASSTMDGVVIQPGQTFSYWDLVGKATEKKGYAKGMLLARGHVVEGVGGGLCQLSNLLYWMFLHGPFEIVERYHHSFDVFPDSGRVLPFGSGATVFYNYVDLVVKNTSDQPIQLKLWLTDSHLKGQLVTTSPLKEKYKIREENHLFLKWGENFFRYNELYKDTYVEGKLKDTQFVVKNFAPVLYDVNEEDLREKGYRVEVV